MSASLPVLMRASLPVLMRASLRVILSAGSRSEPESKDRRPASGFRLSLDKLGMTDGKMSACAP
jgi:hypothetical protein